MDRSTWGFIIVGILVAGSVYPPIIQFVAWSIGIGLILIMLLNIFLPEKYFWPKEFRERMEQREREGSSK